MENKTLPENKLRAIDLVFRKIKVKVNGSIKNYLVTNMNAEPEPHFVLVNLINGKQVKKKVNELIEWNYSDTEIEGITRALSSTIKMFNEHGISKESMPYMDVLKRFEEAKQQLVTERTKPYKVEYESYSVYYDIKYGNNVHRFMNMQELTETKDHFASDDKELASLQVYNQQGELIIDEWEHDI